MIKGNLLWICSMGLLLMICNSVCAQSFPFILKKNGRAVGVPLTMTLSDGTQTIEISLADAKMTLPPAFENAPKLEMVIVVDGDMIDVPGIKPYARTYSWTLILADKNYGPDYQFAVKKGIKVKTSCIFSVDPADGDGTFMVVSPCRKPKAK